MLANAHSIHVHNVSHKHEKSASRKEFAKQWTTSAALKFSIWKFHFIQIHEFHDYFCIENWHAFRSSRFFWNQKKICAFVNNDIFVVQYKVSNLNIENSEFFNPDVLLAGSLYYYYTYMPWSRLIFSLLFFVSLFQSTFFRYSLIYYFSPPLLLSFLTHQSLSKICINLINVKDVNTDVWEISLFANHQFSVQSVAKV